MKKRCLKAVVFCNILFAVLPVISCENEVSDTNYQYTIIQPEELLYFNSHDYYGVPSMSYKNDKETVAYETMAILRLHKDSLNPSQIGYDYEVLINDNYSFHVVKNMNDEYAIGIQETSNNDFTGNEYTGLTLSPGIDLNSDTIIQHREKRFRLINVLTAQNVTKLLGINTDLQITLSGGTNPSTTITVPQKFIRYIDKKRPQLPENTSTRKEINKITGVLPETGEEYTMVEEVIPSYPDNDKTIGKVYTYNLSSINRYYNHGIQLWTDFDSYWLSVYEMDNSGLLNGQYSVRFTDYTISPFPDMPGNIIEVDINRGFGFLYNAIAPSKLLELLQIESDMEVVMKKRTGETISFKAPLEWIMFLNTKLLTLRR
jgi:hypothetical protein